MKNKMEYIIGAVIDRDTNKASEKFGYRVGRKCRILEGCDIGTRLVLIYENGRYLTTSTILEIDETDYGIWFTTLNRLYRLDRIQEEVNE